MLANFNHGSDGRELTVEQRAILIAVLTPREKAFLSLLVEIAEALLGRCDGRN